MSAMTAECVGVPGTSTWIPSSGIAYQLSAGGDAVHLGEGVQHGHEDARAGGADGMAEGDRAAVHVQSFLGELQFSITGQHLRGEGLVELDEIQVVDAERELLE